MVLRRFFTNTKIWAYITIILMLLALIDSKAEAKTVEHSTSADNFAITQADVNLAKEKVRLGMTSLDVYWKQVFTNSGYKYSSPDVYYYYKPVKTACGTIPMQNAAYCSIDNSIYFDINFFTRMMKAVGQEVGTDGDMAIITVLAHEWGHAVQTQTQNFWQLPLLNELGADCFAGAFVGNASRLGYIEAGDPEESILTLAIGGDNAPWYSPQAHGSSSRRINNFREGFSKGVSPCVA